MREPKPYIFLGQTTSLCETCVRPVPAKILMEENEVFYQKRCASHGVQKTLISHDAAYYKSCRDFLKPGDKPLRVQSETHYGCPYDCGLCPDHEQHSCLALIEINEECNLTCPVCFAESSPSRKTQRSLAEVERMLDALCESEGEPDLLQISGGEPTIHPDILPILKACKSRPIRHVMMNTNGIRLAKDKDFVAQLACLSPGFEIYLQFDSLEAEALKTLRGADMRRVRDEAQRNLEEVGLSTTLVCTIRKGVNDNEIGAIIRHALNYSCVRGVTFQPVQDAGRNAPFHKSRDRIVLSEIRQAIGEQSGIFAKEDMLPLPCNPEAICIGYGLRNGSKVTPVTRMLPQEEWVSAAPNTISFERYPELRKKFFNLLSLPVVGDEQTRGRLGELLCCLPGIEVPEGLGYGNVFRVVIIQFMDRFNFCVGGVKRSCIHFVTPQGKIIPFDTHNLFYRNGLIDERRKELDHGAA